MTSVNSRGTFAVTQACLPWLLKSDHAHVLTIAPPLDLAPRWFKDHPAYSLAKFGMSLLSLGWAEEFAGRIAVNCLWPRTTIDTAAVRNLLGGEAMANASRRPEIMGDAARAILEKGVEFTGWLCLDDLVLAAQGVTDFDAYAVIPGAPLQHDFFVPRSAPEPRNQRMLAATSAGEGKVCEEHPRAARYPGIEQRRLAFRPKSRRCRVRFASGCDICVGCAASAFGWTCEMGQAPEGA